MSRNFTRLIALAIVLLLPAAALGQLSTTAPWPKFHRDIKNTGFTPNFGTLIGQLKWRFYTDGSSTSSPALDANGVLYFGSNNNYLYAVNATNGDLVWKYLVGGAIDGSSPALDDNGVLYVGCDDGLLYAFDTTTLNPDNPAPLWTFSTGGAITSSPNIAPDGTIFVSSNDGYLYALNTGGAQLWRRYIGASWSTPAIDASTNTVYAGTFVPQLCSFALDNGTIIFGLSILFGFDTTTGIQVFSWPCVPCVPDGMYASPVITPNGSLLVATHFNNEPEDDCLDYEFHDYNLFYVAASPTEASWALDISGVDFYTTPAVTAANWFIVGANNTINKILPNQHLYITSLAEGERIEDSPAIDGRNYIYFGSNDSTFYCLNANNPEDPAVWSYRITEDQTQKISILSSPAIGNDDRHSVYVGASDGIMYAFYDGAKISGTIELVTYAGGVPVKTPLRDVLITLYDTVTEETSYAYTDNLGYYEFFGIEQHQYLVTPDKDTYIFSPTSSSVTITDKNGILQDATANFEAFEGFAISGTITNDAGIALANVTVTLEGDFTQPVQATTDGSGAYTFTGLGYDTYIVTPSLANYGFTPAFQEVIINEAATGDQTGIDFVGTSGFQVSGRVVDFASQEGLGAITVRLSGAASRTTTTATDGGYSFVGLASGQYTVTPQLLGYDFEPADQTVTVSTSNITNINFSAFTGYQIAGTVTLSGTDNSTSLDDVVVQLFANTGGLLDPTAGTPLDTTTPDADGRFSFLNIDTGSYIVKPVLSGYGFDPISIKVDIIASNAENLVFAGTKGFYITGKVRTLAGMPVADVTVQTGCSENPTTTTTSSDGSYAFTGLSTGTYTVCLQTNDDLQVVPEERRVTISADSAEEINFWVRSLCSQVVLNLPFWGPMGTVVNIYGTNFGLTEPSETDLVTVDGVQIPAGVYFGTQDVATWQQAEVISWWPIRVAVLAPEGSGIVRTWVIRPTTGGGECSVIYPTNFYIYSF